MPDETTATAIAAGISSAGGCGTIWLLFRSWLMRLDRKVDAVIETQGAQGKELAEIRRDMIPNGRERMARIEAKDSVVAPRVRTPRG